MARQWSARCYGVARQREGSRPNSIGGSGVLSLRHFSGWFSLSLGGWVPKKLARRRMVSAGAMLLDRLGPPGFRFTDFRGPALTLSLGLTRARGRCWPGRGLPVATGSLANERGRAKTASGAPACFLSGISGWFSLSLGAWVPKKLARRIGKQGRLLTNRPCSSLVYEESDSKERLRVSNWIVQRLYNYADRKSVV